MTSDPSLTRQDSNYATQIQAALDELQQMQEVPRVVTNPEALDALEREIRGRTARLSSLLLGLHLQHSLDSEDLQAEQALLVSHWPKPLKNDGRVQVWVRTAGGYRVPIWVTYYRRKGLIHAPATFSPFFSCSRAMRAPCAAWTGNNTDCDVASAVALCES